MCNLLSAGLMSNGFSYIRTRVQQHVYVLYTVLEDICAISRVDQRQDQVIDNPRLRLYCSLFDSRVSPSVVQDLSSYYNFGRFE